MRGFSYPSWASVDEIQLGLFAWENSSNWTGRSIYLELPDLLVSGNSQRKQHSKGGMVIQGRSWSGVFTILAG